MKILILFLLIHFSLCQFYQWKTVNYDNIEIPANNPIAVQGFQYQTESTEIQWRLTSFDIFDCYLVNNTNFSLLKLGKPFMYQWGMLNTSNCQGDFVNPTIIQSGLQIVAAHNYPFSIRVSFTLTQNVYVDLWALWIPLIVILAIILSICIVILFFILLITIYFNTRKICQLCCEYKEILVYEKKSKEKKGKKEKKYKKHKFKNENIKKKLVEQRNNMKNEDKKIYFHFE